MPISVPIIFFSLYFLDMDGGKYGAGGTFAPVTNSSRSLCSCASDYKPYIDGTRSHYSRKVQLVTGCTSASLCTLRVPPSRRIHGSGRFVIHIVPRQHRPSPSISNVGLAPVLNGTSPLVESRLSYSGTRGLRTDFFARQCCALRDALSEFALPRTLACALR